MTDLSNRVAVSLALPTRGVAAVLRLFAEGATVPFIARYRKEATGALDEVQIRAIAERHSYLVDLEARRATVLRTIESAGALTPELRRQIEGCATKTELEDLYLPFKPKRRTKAAIARERGLGPLAERVLAQPLQGRLDEDARALIAPDRDLHTVDDVITGVRDIMVEEIGDRADVRSLVRDTLTKDGVLQARAVKAKVKTLGRTKFEDYYEFAEPVRKIASHRYLAIQRGEAEGVLRVKIQADEDRTIDRVRRCVGLDPRSPYGRLLLEAVEEAYKRRLHPALEKEVRSDVLERAERDAIAVFADNLQHLLLAAPFGAKPVVAIDPGIRTGAKCVALDAAGTLLEHRTIHALRSERDRPDAERSVVDLVRRHRPSAIAVGNGTGGREMEQLVRKAVREAGLDVTVVSVNEAGASVYSASELARDELPGVDITIRGAVSIGRRLQDPLAELVKIDPKSVGVGQYQHDVDQAALARALDGVVETAVNRVGVELSTASPALLAYAAGIGPKLAQAIVAHRSERGLDSRRALLKVRGLGPKAFEQAAGFLRLRTSRHPLDRTAVHPERYDLVERMARDLGVALEDLIGNRDALGRIDLSRYIEGDVGEPTLADIVAELERPGRDPRDTFEAPRFRDDVHSLEDLRADMVLEGVVTNVTAFGAFVDIGVHQDGLVHVSQLADRFVREPGTVVKAGERVRVRVLSVDPARRRIALSRRGLASA